jgi:hypothetical protein
MQYGRKKYKPEWLVFLYIHGCKLQVSPSFTLHVQLCILLLFRLPVYTSSSLLKFPTLLLTTICSW